MTLHEWGLQWWVTRRSRKAAARWLVELDMAENIEERWPAFEIWLNERPEHRRAFVRMEKAWRTIEELRGLNPEALKAAFEISDDHPVR